MCALVQSAWHRFLQFTTKEYHFTTFSVYFTTAAYNGIVDKLLCYPKLCYRVILSGAKDLEEAEEEPGVITGEAKEVEEAEEESGVITGEAKELNESEEEHE